MKKLEKRAVMCLILAGVLLAGLGFYVTKWVMYGSEWVSFAANKHVYTDGRINTGSIYDENGDLLLKNTESGKPEYNDSSAVRKATLHAVGDIDGNILTGANRAFSGKLVGYNPVTGTYSTQDKGRKLYLTINAEVCKTANKALNGRKGAVMVYNYKTGNVICMVSSPNYDPSDPPSGSDDSSSGAYINRCTSAKIVPGSIFKTVTAAAAIEQISDLNDFSYTCDGTLQFASSDVDKVTCPYAHGKENFEEALANSCNCAFAKLSIKLGSSNLEKYTKKAGLTKSYDIDGIHTTAGSFDFPDSGVNLGWAGVGQYHDLVNPCSMMIYMGAIANQGKAPVPNLIKKIEFTNGWPASFIWTGKTDTLIKASTAKKMTELMHNNVKETYGESNFPGLDLCAKSGTAEVGGSSEPNAWFTGFLDDDDNPYAFIVLVQNGGNGAEVAGSVANKVLQKIVDQ